MQYMYNYFIWKMQDGVIITNVEYWKAKDRELRKKGRLPGGSSVWSLAMWVGVVINKTFILAIISLTMETYTLKSYLVTKQICENYYLSESCTFSKTGHALYCDLIVFHQNYRFHRHFLQD